MKLVVTVGLLLHLLLHLLLPVSSGPVATIILMNRDCCSAVHRKRVPLENILEVNESSRTCPVKAIIVKTSKRELCLDPDWAWAAKRLEERRSTRPRTPRRARL